MKTLLLAPPVIYYNPYKEMQPTCLNEMSGFPTPTTKSQLKDGSFGKIFTKQLIEFEKNSHSRVLLSYSVPLRIYH